MNKTNTRSVTTTSANSSCARGTQAGARHDFQSGRIDAAALKAVEDDAIRDLVVNRKRRVTTSSPMGEFRRATWHLDFMWGFHGVGRTPTKTGLPFQGEAAMLTTPILREGERGRASLC